MRVQISKALKTRSKAVKTAVSAYNNAAKKLGKPALELKSVLDYAHLGQFDLLRSSRHNITEKAWSRPAEREAAATYFKLCRSEEERIRSELEARRLVRYVVAFEKKIHEEIQHLEKTDADLAWQLCEKYRIRRTQDEMHLLRLHRSALRYVVNSDGKILHAIYVHNIEY